MFFIRQGATHKVVVGPAVAVGDGFTPVTNLALSSADEAEAILHDNGTVVDISAYTWAAIATADGYYHLTLQSGISGTVGHMTVVVNDDSLVLPVREDFTVLEEAVYDQLYAASAPGAATVAIGSDIHSSLVVVKSDLIVIDDLSSDIHSSLVIARSDLVISNSDTTAIHTQTTTIASDVVLAEASISDIESSLVIVKSDLVVHEAMLSDVESSLVIVKSDLVITTSDTAAIEAAGAGTSPDVLVSTTIATLATQTSFTLTAGSADDDAYTGMVAIFQDQSTATQKAIVFITDYVGSTKTVTLEAGPIFTIATGDTVSIMAAGGSVAEDSKLTKIASDVVVLDAAISDVESSLVIVKSDLVISNSDTTAIHTQTTTAAGNISDIESSLVIVKSDLVIITSDIGDIIVGEGGLTPTQESQLTRIQSDLIIAQSDIVIIGSDLLQVYSDTTRIDSNTVLAETNISDIESSLVIIKSDLVVHEAMLSDIESSLVIAKSDLVIVGSDTAALEVGVNVARVATVTIDGVGTEGDPFGPA